MNKGTINLASLIDDLGELKAEIVHGGFYDKLHCYFDPGIIKVKLLPNKLKSGYMGNTLLVPLESRRKTPSHVIISLNDLLILNAVLIVEIDNTKYTLLKRYNFLKINAIQL
nr:hypothetical protein [Cytophagales bacterium]